MDRSYQSCADLANNATITTATGSSGNTTNAAANSSRDQYLRQLNKFSHKISKPIIPKKPAFDSPQNPNFNQNNHPQPPQQQQQSLQHQPPVYNINKNDFRDVVQKLTGSPAHERMSTPPPIQQPKPQSSRLQRIRPPPLAQISNRPPSLLSSALPPPQPQPSSLNPASAIPNNSINAFSVNNNFSGFGRPVAPLSPLPPFPTVHAAAESPVSAYMRYLQNSASNFDANAKQFSGFTPLSPLVSPRRNNFPPQQPQPDPQSQPQGMLPPQTSSAMAQSQSQSQSQMQVPASPFPFGFLNSPMSPYPLLSPSLLFSPPTGQLGFPQFPLSPTVPLPSPTRRGL